MSPYGTWTASTSVMENLSEMKVAILVTDGFEEAELLSPLHALKDAGAKVHIISPDGGKVQAFKHTDKSIQVDSDRKLDEVQAEEYDAVVLPGGAVNADALRIIPRAQQFIKAINDAEKPIAVICHGPWILVSSNLVKGRTLTSWPTLVDDIKNAGGNWQDSEVIVNQNWVSSRKPDDLPAFNREMIKLFKHYGSTRKTVAA